MESIAVIAVNDGCHEREECLRNFISETLKSYGVDVLQFESQDIKEMIKQSKKEAKKVILAFDALSGMNSRFAIAARELYNENIKPLLLVTNADAEEADINFAKDAIGEIWTMEDSSLESWDLYFNNLYFSYQKMAIDTVPQVEEFTNDGIKALVEFIKS